MPKAAFIFNLPEESEEYRIAAMAADMHTVLWNLKEWLRNQIKYNGRNDLEEIRERLNGLLEAQDIYL